MAKKEDPWKISIYEGNAVHHINPVCNKIELSTTNADYAQYFDKRQADGEASIIEINNESLLWINIYTEDANGNKIEKRELLGELFRNDPTNINDYFDDTRWNHT